MSAEPITATSVGGPAEPGPARPGPAVLPPSLHPAPGRRAAPAVLRTLLDALAPGSHLVLSHGTAGFIPAEVRDRVTGVHSRATAPLVGRTREQVGAFLTGLDVLEPGVVTVPLRRPDATPAPGADRVSMYGAIARKP
ncbi:SAM-dependent methyltransferase [Kitasatospora sp. NPDC054939]